MLCQKINYNGANRSRVTSSEAIAIILVGDGNGLVQGSGSGGNENKDSTYVLKAEASEFVDGTTVRDERQKGVRTP